MKRIRIDSTTLAVDANTLRLRIDEYKRLRAEDAEKIRRLGVKVKNLEAAARHEIEITGPIDAVVRDTVVIRDTVTDITSESGDDNASYPTGGAYRERTSER